MLASIRRNVAWRVILMAGVAAGTVHLLVNLIFTPMMTGINPGLLLHYFGSLLLGPDVLTGGGMGAAIVGVVVHYVLSIILAGIIALVVHRWGMLIGLVGGAILGLAFYGINLYTFTLLYPWMFVLNTPIFLISHLLFGLTAGGVYERYDKFDLPLTEEPAYDA